MLFRSGGPLERVWYPWEGPVVFLGVVCSVLLGVERFSYIGVANSSSEFDMNLKLDVGQLRPF